MTPLTASRISLRSLEKHVTTYVRDGSEAEANDRHVLGSPLGLSHSRGAESSAMERPVCAYEDSFLVEDASGARFHIHRFTCRRFFSRVSRYELDTGDLAQRVDDHVFAIVETGERLMRV
jgi:hypothetical protein